MAITIGSNIASLQAQRRLGDATKSVTSIYERLSSGQRINRASDDAAGLAVALSLNVASRVYTQGARNLNDAISAQNISEGALSSLRDITIRQRELCTQSANGTYSSAQRAAMSTEFNALVDEYNRVTKSTTFNGLNLFDPTQGNVIVQAGFGSTETLSMNLNNQLTSTSSNMFTGYNSTAGTGVVASGDVNGDGINDIVTSSSGEMIVSLGNGNGTFRQGATGAVAATAKSDRLIDLNGDGILDFVYVDSSNNCLDTQLGNGNGTFKAVQTVGVGSQPGSLASGDFNGDGKTDIVVGNYLDNTVNILLGNGDGKFKTATTIGVGASPSSICVGDTNGDGKQDIIVANKGDGTISQLLGVGDGTFSSGASRDPTILLTLQDPQGDPQDVNDFSFSINTGGGAYYVWCDGTGSDPDPQFPGTGIRVDLTNNDYGEAAISDIANAINAQSGGAISASYLGNSQIQLAINIPGSASVVDNSYASNFALAGPPRTIISGSSNSFAAGAVPNDIKLCDLNGDGRLDIVSADSSIDNFGVGHIDVLLNAGNGNFSAATSIATVAAYNQSIEVADFNGDGAVDVIASTTDRSQLLFGNGDGTLQYRNTIGNVIFHNSSISYVSADFNGDGRQDLVIGGTGEVALYSGNHYATISHIDISSRLGALYGARVTDYNLGQIESQLGSIGATSSRFVSALQALQSRNDNLIAASSRITDVDVASESAKLVISQILQQAASSVLAQANQQPSLVLQLLRG